MSASGHSHLENLASTFVRNDGSKALSCQAYHEATEAVRMSVFVQPGESKRTDYDSRSTWDRLLDAGSTPARSTKNGSVELLFFRNEFALIYRLGNA